MTPKPAKKKGGFRKGSGRKKIERAAAVKDPQFASRVLEQVGSEKWKKLLKAIEDSELYVSRLVSGYFNEKEDAEAKSKKKRTLPATPPDPRSTVESDEDLALYWLACSDRGIGNRTFINFVEKRDGKAMHTVNHLHDKPVEHNVTLSLSEGMRIAMQKAEERVNRRRA